MTPGISTGESPPFHRLPPRTFEKLCRDLVREQPDVEACDLYGIPGQTQHGIDLQAYLQKNKGVDVAQCKCYAKFSDSEIKDASDAFLKHWSKIWRRKIVRRFILILACDVDDTDSQEALRKERARFKRKGLRYELWSGSTLRTKLAPYRHIVSAYCVPAEHWVREICGVPPPGQLDASSSRVSVQVQSMLLRQHARLVEVVSEDTDQRIERLRLAWQEGRRREARSGIAQLRADRDRWEELSARVRAKALTLQAAISIEEGSLDMAKDSANEAAGLDPSESQHHLWALLALRESGPSAALEILEPHDDPRTVMFKAAIAISEGRNADALQLLERPGVTEHRPAEAHRVKALAYLGRKDLPSARAAINQAVESGRNLFDVRYAAAMVSYFECLVETAIPGRIPAWPLPVDWLQVRRESGVPERLQRTAAEFAELLLSQDLSEADRRPLQGWRLACLANDFERQEAAKSYAIALLRGAPDHAPAIWWGLQRGYSFPLAASIEGLRESLSSSDGPAVAISLAACLVASRQYDQAASMLASQQQKFTGSDANAQWEYWRVRTLIGLRDLAGLRHAAAEFGIEAVRIAELGLLELEAQASGDYTAVLQHLDSAFRQSGEILFLLEGCETAASRGNWLFVADHADVLTSDSVVTAETLRLALFGLFNASRYDRCLPLIEKHRHVFLGGRLPTDVREIRSRAQHHLGILPLAISEAEELAREVPTASNCLHLAQLYLDIGDMRNLAGLGQKLLQFGTISVQELLRFSAILRASDRRLAVSLWRSASRRGIPNELVATAFQVVSSLGLSEERQKILDRLLRMGPEEEHGITIQTYAEFTEWIARRRSQTQEIEARYRAGQIPVHFVAGPLGWNLADVYHGMPALAQEEGWAVEHGMALVRSGNREAGIRSGSLTQQTRLNIDVTSLLLAAHLGILPTVEEAFAALRIPQDVTRCLSIFRDQLLPQDPSGLEACRLIADLLDKGRLKTLDEVDDPAGHDTLASAMGREWVGMVIEARAKGGRLVSTELAAKTAEQDSGVPGEFTPYVITPQQLAQQPESDAPRPSQERKPRVPELSHIAESSGDIGPGTILYVHTGALYELAGTGALSAICSRFDVRVLASDVRAARNAVAEATRRARIDDWLAELQDRIRNGLQVGRYEVIARQREREGVAAAPLPGSLLSLMQFVANENDVIWVDDRYANSFVLRETVPVVSITEVLQHLLKSGRLNRERHDELLMKLREGNFAFIPLSADEIARSLQHVAITEQGIIETPALQTIRRYVASSQLRTPDLGRPNSETVQLGNFGELTFAFELNHAISRAISRVWQAGADDECRKKSEWIVDNLAVDARFRIRLLGRVIEDESARRMKGLHLASILGFAITLWSPGDAGARDRFRRFCAWFQERVFAREAERDDRTARHCATELKGLLRDIASRNRGEPRQTRLRILHQLILDLPEDFRQYLIDDKDFAEEIELPVISVVRVGDLSFARVEYLEAVARCLRGEDTAIVPLGRLHPVTFKKHGSTGFAFQPPEQDVKGVVDDPTLAVLLESRERRVEALQHHKDWFEGTSADASIRQIADIETASDRLDEVVTWRDESTAEYYRRLGIAMRATRQFTADDARPPSVAGYLRHLRLTEWQPGVSFSAALSNAMSVLLNEGTDAAEVFARMAGIPCAFPAIEEHLSSRFAEDLATTIARISALGRSPLLRVAELRLLLSQTARSPTLADQAAQIVAELVSSEGQRDAQLFESLLRYSEHLWIGDPKYRALAVPIRLALVWAHTHRLFALFDLFGADRDWMESRFDPTNNRPLFNVFSSDTEYESDVCHPDNVNAVEILVTGLADALRQYPVPSISAGVRERVKTLTFVAVSDSQFPILPLLRDVTAIPNALGSYIGTDRGLLFQDLLGSELATAFSSSHLQTIARAALAGTASSESSAGQNWAVLAAVVATGNPYPGLMPELEVAIRRARVDTGGRDIGSTLIGLRALATLAGFSSSAREEVLTRVRMQLLDVAASVQARKVTGASSDTSLDERLLLLMVDVAYQIARTRRSNEEQAVSEFSEITSELTRRLPTLRALVRPLIEQLAEKLPSSQAQHLWQLLLLLRSLS